MKMSAADKNHELCHSSIQALSDIAYGAIRDAILSHRLAVGERLIESELAEMIGVSRTPLREAMRNLEVDGFVTIIPRKGTYVASFNLLEVDRLFDVRAQMEAFSAEKAAEVATPADIQALERMLQEEETALASQNAMESIRADENFHMEIARITQNPYVMEILKYIQKRNIRYRALQPNFTTRLQRVRREHVEILNAIREKNPDWARAAMRENIESARQVFLLALDGASDSADKVDG